MLRQRWKNASKDPSRFTRKGNTRTTEGIKKCVRSFFERDNVSRITTGRKQTKTKHKMKKQKRFLGDTLQNVPQQSNFLLIVLPPAPLLGGQSNPVRERDLFVQVA